jgi:hypothetical protein
MRQVILSICLLMICNTGIADDPPPAPRAYCPREVDPGYDSREASVLSMMGWGVGLFAGIAILCALLNNNPSDSSSSSTP